MSKESMDFYIKLKSCSEDKNLLLRMAAEAIAFSHDKRTLSQRRAQDLQFNPTSIKLGSAVGTIRAFRKQNLSTNDKLCMIINKYIELETKNSSKRTNDKALKNFDEEFAKQYPKQYGERPAFINRQVRNNSQEMAVG